MWREYNPNPSGARVGDCAVRSMAAALDKDWCSAYLELCVEGLMQLDLPNSNAVWGAYLKKNGFKRFIIPDTCPDCYTVKQFAEEHPNGVYVLAISGHVVTVIDGDWYDTWDSGQCVPLYYWTKEE